MKKISVHSVNISEKKGTIKVPVPGIQLGAQGVEGDAHSGNWHRMVSLLARESIVKFEHQAHRAVTPGEFAENITSEGMLLYECRPLDRFTGDHVSLEVTQIGKECHGDACAIFREVGSCVMPKEGIFARVLSGGKLQAGDVLTYEPKVHRIHVITLSDRASQGVYEDRSGPAVEAELTAFFEADQRIFEITKTLIPDDAEMLTALIAHAVNSGVDAIFTTGGTGVGEHDITPETVEPMFDKSLPGVMEMIRIKYGSSKPQALLSRSIAGVIGRTQVYCLPGSVRACKEYMSELLKTYHHLMLMLHGIDAH